MAAPTFQKKLLPGVIALALVGAPFQHLIAAETAADEKDKDAEVVEVHGIRDSLKANLADKRDADAVVDVVTADDIGKFPDKNVAEALQRIPGVSIQRDFGEGENVSIRGTAPALNMTLLNGQNVATASWFILDDASRNFNYSMLPSEVVGKLEVYKSPQADIDEGSVGGTVILHTRRPLSLESGTVYGSVEGQRSTSSDETDPQFSGLFSWRNTDASFGVLASYINQKRTLERHGIEAFGLYSPSTTPDPTNVPYYHPWGVGAAMFQQEREREGINVVAQSSLGAWDATVNYMKAEVQADNINRNYIAIPSNAWSPWAGDCIAQGALDSVQASGNVLTEATITDPSAACVMGAQDVIARKSSMETEMTDLDLTYTGNSFKGHFQIGTTEAKGGTKRDLFWEFFDSAAGYSSGTLRLTNHGYVFDWARDVSQPSAGGKFTGYHDNSRPEHNDEDYAQVDLTFDLNSDFFTNIKAGLKMRDREQGVVQYDGAAPFALTADDLDETDFASYAVTGLPGAPYAYWSLTQGSGEAWTASVPVCTAGQTSATDRCVSYSQNYNSSYEIGEDITAAYAMASFNNGSIRGNFGLRQVETEVNSDAYLPNGTPTHASSSYSDTLPAANIVWQVADDLLVRGAISKVIARPDTAQMTSAVILIPETSSASGGNPEIDPYRATQFDVGTEWYFADSSILALTYFDKSIDNYIVDETKAEVIGGVTYNNVTRPRNGGDASISGLELQFQYDFGNGFGAYLNLTKLTSDTEDAFGNSIEVPYAAEKTANVSAYFENKLLSARISLNDRDEYFVGIVNNQYLYSDSFATVDASVLVHVTEQVDLSFEGLNLNDEQTQQTIHTTTGEKIPWNYYDNGKRYFAGVKVRF